MERSEARAITDKINQKSTLSKGMAKNKKKQKLHQKKDSNQTQEQNQQQIDIQQGNQINQNINQLYIYQKSANNKTSNIQQVVINQLSPVVAKPLDSIEFKVNQKILVCPFCNKMITTQVQKKFNNWAVCGCIFRIIFIPLAIFFIIYSCITTCDCGGCCECCCCDNDEEESDKTPEIPDKDCCNCFNDATHYCPECKKKLGSYSSCPCIEKIKNCFNMNENENDA